MIIFNEPQEQEKIYSDPLNFNGYVYTKPGEEYNKEVQDEKIFYKPSVEVHEANISTIKKSNNQNIKVLKAEGVPFSIKEAEKANKYEQFTPYSNLVWEPSLSRDYKNDDELNSLKKELGEEYVQHVQGE